MLNGCIEQDRYGTSGSHRSPIFYGMRKLIRVAWAAHESTRGGSESRSRQSEDGGEMLISSQSRDHTTGAESNGFEAVHGCRGLDS